MRLTETGEVLASRSRRTEDPTLAVWYRSFLFCPMRTMPQLTRRRDPEAQQETWLIYYGDVQVGTIAERAGNPAGSPRWQWACDFYPGSHPSEHAKGTAETFDQARGAFEIAWRFFRAKRYGG